MTNLITKAMSFSRFFDFLCHNFTEEPFEQIPVYIILHHLLTHAKNKTIPASLHVEYHRPGAVHNLKHKSLERWGGWVRNFGRGGGGVQVASPVKY